MRYVYTSRKGKKRATRPAMSVEASAGSSPVGSAPAGLSETLVTFAEPLLRLFQHRPGEALLRSVFSLAALAWNEGNPHHPFPPREAMRIRDRLMREFGAAWNDVIPYYQELVRTRHEKLGADRRVVTDFRLEHGAEGKWQIYVAGGELETRPG